MMDFPKVPPGSDGGICNIKLEGLEQLFRNLNLVERKYAKAFNKGVFAGIRAVEKETNKYVPFDPMHDPDDESKHLRGSAVIGTQGTGWDTEAALMYDKDYAIYVHEDLNKAHGSAYNIAYASQIAAGKLLPRGPEERAKFLEIGVANVIENGSLLQTIYSVVVSQANVGPTYSGL